MSTRTYEVLYERAEFGRSVVGIRCPYCGAVTEAYVWSLAGSGKRCACGAVHHWLHQTSTKETDDE
jgi:hypothetical protein